MPEITELKIAVNAAEIKAGTQAVNDLAAASKQTGEQVEKASSKFGNFEPRVRAQAEAARTAADANIALGAGGSDAADGLLKALEAVNGFTKASAKIGEAGLNADIGKIKDGLGEMANATGLTELAMKRLGAGPLLALQMAADVAAFVAEAFVQGQLESDKFSRALELTGNAAGITEGQFNTMVASVAESSQGGLGDTRVALQTLVETGQFTSEALNSVGAAAVTMAQMNGQSAGAVAADFATMADGVTNWVDTHDKNYNILTGAQYAHIAALEKEGKTQEAMVVASDLINAGLQKRAEKLSMIGTLLQGSKNLWSSFMDGMRSIGREETPEDEIEKIKKRTAEVRRTGQLVPGTHPAARLTGAQMEQFEQEQARALEVATNKKTQREAKAKADQDESKRNADGKQAVKDLDEMQKRYVTKAEREVAEIKKLEETLANARAGGVAVSPEKEKELRQKVHASFAGSAKVAAPPAAGSDPRDAVLAGQLQAIQSALRIKTEGYDQQAKLDDARRKGGALSEDEFFANRRMAISARGAAEVAAYQQQADVLKGFQAKTAQGQQERDNKIAEAGAAQVRVQQQVNADLAQLEETARQEKEAAAKKRDEEAKAKETKNRADAKAADEKTWKDTVDGAKAIGDALEKAFGKAGAAVGKLGTAFADYQKAQRDVQRTLKEGLKDAGDDEPKKDAAYAKAREDGAQAQIKGYRDMAGAAKGFFKENSTGYKLMEGAEKAFRAVEMAGQLQKLATSLFVSGSSAAGVVVGQATETGAVMAGQAAQNAAKVPGVFMSFMSSMGPWGYAAAAAAIAAVLGGAFSGGGGADTTAKDRQAANGTGTVLGDSSAKSDSIAKSLEIMEKNSGLGLAYSSSMVVSLKQIVSGIGGLGSLLVRSDILTSALGTKGSASGGFIGNVVSSIFGGKTTVQDVGIVTNSSSLGDLDTKRFNVNSYVDIKKSGGWFSSDKKSTNLTAMGAETNDQFTKIVLGLRTSIVSAADLLGMGGDAFTSRLNSFVVSLGKISLKDLKGEEVQKALEAAFSKLGDDMAKFGVGGLEKYQAVGEGYLETLARVANNYMQVSDVLAVLGKSFNTSGLSAVALSESLIHAAGDLDTLTSGTSFFVQNFLSEAEQMDPVTKSVRSAMAALGQSGVTTSEQFKALVLAQDLNTVAGQNMYVQLLAIAEPFKKAADYAADLAAATGELAEVSKTASDIAGERKDMQQQLNELTKTEAQLLAAQRASVADANRGLFDQIQAVKAVTSAKDALAKAYETESAAAKSALEKSKSWVTTLNGLNASMALGAQSTLTPEQKYAEARAQFEKTLAAANAGDTTAQSGLSAAEQAFLTASQVVNASDARYAADYARVVEANKEALKWAAAQVDVQQASLDALNAQVSGLITINDSVLTVAQAIAGLRAAMGGAADLGVQFSNPPVVAALAAMTSPVTAAVFDPVRYSSAANVGSDVLVAEIRGLREDNQAMRVELEGLRADQRAQTGATIQATFESNANAARTVVDGVDKSSRASAWANAVKGEYA
ncbi:phage tail length tape measure family protein [Janthinobacterium lividum]|uniref:Phage tail length tape measure family protein n=1 Tax=Janthinobacterium lividum TaxID=29581 RepID=A0ABU0XP71_9BURK|nr:phage tail length tape measure family protein [Janthinobacterium lividum]MDQ4625310.1 phage tail length tape measure family protein [Janthinobacterium lividum]MDQ4673087.1 phage tail length tape measure family protein [Janthinobacterium lividum]MDQ4683816.1 phage tail length tape measure family protein [Janthinobacterium lividum]